LSLDGFQEILDTISEATSIVSSLTPDLSDKKGISDVMLALEKITPEISGGLGGKMAGLCELLAQLFEKFLMEMVGDGSVGIKMALKGLSVLQESIEESSSQDTLDEQAVMISTSLFTNYGVCVAGLETGQPTDSQKEPDEPLGQAGTNDGATPEPVDEADEEDDFFAGIETGAGAESVERGAAADREEEAEPANPIVEKLSQLANDVTMLDADMTDKKMVSDIMLELEEITKDMNNEGSDRQVTSLTGTLGLLYEKSLMEGLENGQRAIELSADAIMILSAYFERTYPPDLPDQAAQVRGKIEDEFGIAPVDDPHESQDDGDETSTPVVESPEEPGKTQGMATQAGCDIVKVASDEDLLIYCEFVLEVNDSVAGIESDLLELEENPTDEELINSIFRAFHSMKGAAGFLGVNTVNILCHEAETLLDKFRKKTLVCNQEMMDALLKTVDVVKLVNEGLDTACQGLKTKLPNADLEIPRFHIDSLVQLLTNLASGERTTVMEQDEEEEKEGEEEGGEEEIEPIGAMLVNEQKISRDQLETALESQQAKPLGEILVDMGAIEKSEVEQALKSQAEKKKKIQASSIKIDTEKLDSLLELVGELVISQSIVGQDESLVRENNRVLHKNITNLGKITKNIQDRVMTLRMVPLKQTFQKMNRLVRDLAKKMKKPVRFNISGADTEIDKTLIEELNDPLVHLLRNSMDHGLESVEERVSHGKDKTGNVWLSASHKGGNVQIEVIDDGKGLDRERIRRKAIEKGLIPDDAELSEQELYNLILQPGFSTHDVATDISGRGVGMDVVKSNLDKLGGRLEITSKPGEGSTFLIKLPLTLAIVDGMIVRIGEDRYVIPTISIRESIRPARDSISTYKKKGEMIDVRGRLLPMIRLHRRLGIMDAIHENPWEGIVIIVESDGKEFGFLVDDLLGQQQVVIKSLDKRFKGLPGISGGTILGDGRVGLILDVSSVAASN